VRATGVHVVPLHDLCLRRGAGVQTSSCSARKHPTSSCATTCLISACARTREATSSQPPRRLMSTHPTADTNSLKSVLKRVRSSSVSPLSSEPCRTRSRSSCASRLSFADESEQQNCVDEIESLRTLDLDGVTSSAVTVYFEFFVPVPGRLMMPSG
jgi:hypothetical protein